LINAIDDYCNLLTPQMYRIHHNRRLSNEEFHVLFCGTLDLDNPWVLFSSLMPWETLGESYAPQFNPTTGAPAKPVMLAFGELFIKQRLGLTDEETVEQIRDNAYMHFASALPAIPTRHRLPHR